MLLIKKYFILKILKKIHELKKTILAECFFLHNFICCVAYQYLFNFIII